MVSYIFMLRVLTHRSFSPYGGEGPSARWGIHACGSSATAPKPPTHHVQVRQPGKLPDGLSCHWQRFADTFNFPKSLAAVHPTFGQESWPLFHNGRHPQL